MVLAQKLNRGGGQEEVVPLRKPSSFVANEVSHLLVSSLQMEVEHPTASR